MKLKKTQYAYKMFFLACCWVFMNISVKAFLNQILRLYFECLSYNTLRINQVSEGTFFTLAASSFQFILCSRLFCSILSGFTIIDFFFPLVNYRITYWLTRQANQIENPWPCNRLIWPNVSCKLNISDVSRLVGKIFVMPSTFINDQYCVLDRLWRLC